MDVNESIDVGQNITTLFEKLAIQIGVTVDKVFPWFVKQAYIEGWLITISIILIMILAGIINYVSWKRLNFTSTSSGLEPNRWVIGCIIGVVLFAASLSLIPNLCNSIADILNPEYRAIKYIVELWKVK